MSLASYILVISTVSSLKEARKIAQLLLGERLAACVNIVPAVESHYWWQHKKAQSKESLLMIKTRAVLYDRIEKVIRENHSYSVPEVISLPIQKGSEKYLRWIDDEVNLPLKADSRRSSSAIL